MSAPQDVQMLDQIKHLLLSEQRRLNDLLAKSRLHLKQTDPLKTEVAEQAVETDPDQLDGALDQQAQITLSQINKALLRLHDGRYGECVVCGRQIAPQRLRAIPHTPFCYHCVSAK